MHPMTARSSDRKMIIEAYPALVKNGKYRSALSPFRELLPDHVPIGTDAYDAALCAVMALAYGAEGAFAPLPKLVGPPEHLNSIKTEGWIYYPIIGDSQ
jgi:hypothetical protein